MSLADTGRSQQNHVGCLMHEPHHAQLANLPFIDRRLECKIRPIEGPQTRQVGQLQPGLQVTLLSSWASIAVIRAGPDSPHPVVENLLRHSAPYLERGFVHPRGSLENRPMITVAKPANGIDPEHSSYIPPGGVRASSVLTGVAETPKWTL